MFIFVKKGIKYKTFRFRWSKNFVTRESVGSITRLMSIYLISRVGVFPLYFTPTGNLLSHGIMSEFFCVVFFLVYLKDFN